MGLPEPLVQEIGMRLRFTVFLARPIVLDKQQVGSRSGHQDGLVERLVDGLAESQRQILLLITENPHISKRELAERIGISTTAIDKNIKTLKKQRSPAASGAGERRLLGSSGWRS